MLRLIVCTVLLVVNSGNAVWVGTDSPYYQVNEGGLQIVRISTNSSSELDLEIKFRDELRSFVNLSVKAGKDEVLRFNNVSIEQSGSYSIYQGIKKEASFKIKVTHLSSITLYQLLTEKPKPAEITCVVSGYPKPTINWVQQHDSCNKSQSYTVESQNDLENTTSISFLSKRTVKYSLFDQTSTGKLICVVSNGITSTKNRTWSGPLQLRHKQVPVVTIHTSLSSIQVNIYATEIDQETLYKVLLHPKNNNNCANRHFDLKYPKLDVLIENLCKKTEYKLQIFSSHSNCPDEYQTVFSHTIAIGLDESLAFPGGTIASIVLSALLAITLMLLCCTRLKTRKSQKVEDFSFLSNLSASTLSMMPKRKPSVVKLNDSSDYVAAFDISSEPSAGSSDTAVILPIPQQTLLKPKIRITSTGSDDYALPYDFSKDQRTSSLELLEPEVTKKAPRRAQSLFLGDGSNYVAAEYKPRKTRSVKLNYGSSRNRKTITPRSDCELFPCETPSVERPATAFK